MMKSKILLLVLIVNLFTGVAATCQVADNKSVKIPIAYTWESSSDPSMCRSEVKILQQGVDGEREIFYKITKKLNPDEDPDILEIFYTFAYLFDNTEVYSDPMALSKRVKFPSDVEIRDVLDIESSEKRTKIVNKLYRWEIEILSSKVTKKPVKEIGVAGSKDCRTVVDEGATTIGDDIDVSKLDTDNNDKKSVSTPNGGSGAVSGSAPTAPSAPSAPTRPSAPATQKTCISTCPDKECGSDCGCGPGCLS